MDSQQPRSDGPRRRRAFTASEKLAHLSAYEAACEHGDGGGYLRREGLYSSLISEWRKQRDAGVLAGKAPGEKVVGKHVRSVTCGLDTARFGGNHPSCTDVRRPPCSCCGGTTVRRAWEWGCRPRREVGRDGRLVVPTYTDLGDAVETVDVLSRGARPAEDAREAVTQELAGVLFASFTRRDQRVKGAQYLRGLLDAQGRKSIRNIAAQVGGAGAEQSLHHFISSSTWDWMPVREALATHLARVSTPEAWVVQPMAIPKAGDQSVGVDHGFDSYVGQPFRGQRAFGVWSASEELSTPVDWRLFLPEAWVRDRSRRHRAEIPDSVGEETLEECAAAVLDSVRSWRVPSRPVVLNTHICDITSTIGRFREERVPVIARVGRAAQLTVRDPALPGYGEGALSALQILTSIKGLRRPAEWTDPATGAARSSLAVAIRVGITSGSGRPHRAGGKDLVLLGEWDDPQRPPEALWITTMDTVPTGALLRLTKFGDSARTSLAGVGEAVGLKDFEGRSFRGWHRHVTLASAAHAVAALTGSTDTPPTEETPEDYYTRRSA